MTGQPLMGPRGPGRESPSADEAPGREWFSRLLAADRRVVTLAMFPLALFAVCSLAGFIPDGAERALRPLWFLYPLLTANLAGLALYDTFNSRARARRRGVAAYKRGPAAGTHPAAARQEDDDASAASEAREAAPEEREVLAPVTGRWEAINSPADKVPSHGVHAHAQTYAIDITAAPEGAPPRSFGWWPLTRQPTAFPAFGAPVLAGAEATVVRVLDRHRDHRSRDSYPVLPFHLLEGIARETAGVSWLLGNHVILRLHLEGGTTYAVYAHLQRGSVTVTEGDTVRAGQAFAKVGNSGNSSDPHLHFQLMDGPDTERAHGIPFRWRGLGVPAAGTPWEAPGHADAPPGHPGVRPQR